ncbi:hypothetical protein EIN_093580 [Entamoeba invadens IP1]|uniref:Uncharacterized protein n=1 Tax=Entamoeba invadens IP1 TaxID=370355 RepID=A0A0A1U5U6_ENTIV|nr:hypothetical protein EIN_093580 [Entamoeba invadens IP1]ELP87201.1 hypothetical protein EIN_093580 [Entamoeba invadens IP1]|eukprot:XP_004253972.1 hypothetical protein EIN_093580 [Entamoeba invadens IP1]
MIHSQPYHIDHPSEGLALTENPTTTPANELFIDQQIIDQMSSIVNFGDLYVANLHLLSNRLRRFRMIFGFDKFVLVSKIEEMELKTVEFFSKIVDSKSCTIDEVLTWAEEVRTMYDMSNRGMRYRFYLRELPLMFRKIYASSMMPLKIKETLSLQLALRVDYHQELFYIIMLMLKTTQLHDKIPLMKASEAIEDFIRELVSIDNKFGFDIMTIKASAMRSDWGVARGFNRGIAPEGTTLFSK